MTKNAVITIIKMNYEKKQEEEGVDVDMPVQREGRLVRGFR